MGSEACTDCFVKWDISDFREDAFMQYQLKKVNIHLPFWLEWNGWTDSKGQNIGGYSDEYKDWARNSNEYVQLQEVGNDAFRRGFNLSLAYD